jgi:hypothetical protein
LSKTNKLKNLIRVIKGDLPILITCPHDGNETIYNVPTRQLSNIPEKCHGEFNTLADSFTREICLGVYDNIFNLTKQHPTLIIFEGIRACLDVNREEECAFEVPEAKIFYDEYHRNIAKSIKFMQVQNIEKNGFSFLFDIHGASFNSKYDLIIGTRDGESIRQLIDYVPDALWKSDGLITLLRGQGIRVHPPEKGRPEMSQYKGGFTIKKYGSMKGNGNSKRISNNNGYCGLNAIQLELTRSIRKNYSQRQILMRKLAWSIASFVCSLCNNSFNIVSQSKA